MNTIHKILVANRGEIALRIMKTAHRMGIKTVAVFSEVDRMAPHVLYADEAVHIGDNPSSESYLNKEKIINAAKQTGADAIHPGYGFLSENAEFSSLVKSNGLVFIGPDEHAIKLMGSKLEAKAAVKKFEIPMLPGTESAVSDVREAKVIASHIGYPVLIKASAGGGGKGMRVVEKESDLEDQMKRAISEAKSSFGDGSVFIEKYIASPRHIEIQVLADNHGNIVHLFERECSIQRRHQKVVEEAPSAILDSALRDKMGEAAIHVAYACNYKGAGTVEFLLDENKQFYFLEMNTRLQVEHPVTEMITGVDLVEQQIRVAQNEKLSLSQDQIRINGHAIELRVYAEDPFNNFLPSIGTLEKYRLELDENIRLDSGYREGMEIPIYYDPMIAKLVAYGKNRKEAIQRLKEAIQHFLIEGIETTLPFGLFVCNHKDFQEGNFDTHFVQDHFDADSIVESKKIRTEIAGQFALKAYLKEKERLRIPKLTGTEWFDSRK